MCRIVGRFQMTDQLTQGLLAFTVYDGIDFRKQFEKFCGRRARKSRAAHNDSKMGEPMFYTFDNIQPGCKLAEGNRKAGQHVFFPFQTV